MGLLFFIAILVLAFLLLYLYFTIKRKIEEYRVEKIRRQNEKLKKSIEVERQNYSHLLPNFKKDHYPIFFYANEQPVKLAYWADYYSKYEGLAYEAQIQEEKLFSGKSQFNDYDELSQYLSNKEKSIAPKQGKSEWKLSKPLKEKFGECVNTGQQIGKYYPDIVIQDALRHIYLIVEIDERTTKVVDIDEDGGDAFLVTKRIHIKENIPTERTKYLISSGWSIIRFSDEQVLANTPACINLISAIVAYLAVDKNYIPYDGQNVVATPVYV